MVGLKSLFTKHYTAADIHKYIDAKFLILLNDLNKELQEARLPEKYQEELHVLESLNLTESNNFKQLQAFQDKIDTINKTRADNIETIKFMKVLKAYFGENCILIKHEHFNELLEKYNLASGALHNYTGSIPLENLKEISKVKEKLEILDAIKCFLKIEPNCSLENNILYGTYRSKKYWDTTIYDFEKQYAPLTSDSPKAYLDLDRVYRYIYRLPSDFIDIQSTNDIINILKFQYLKEVTRVYINGKYRNNFSRSNLIRLNELPNPNVQTTGNPFKLFIVALAQEMDIKVEVSRFIQSEDPFICGYTDLGIVIFTAWGDETNDEIISRYKELQTYL